MALEMSCMAAPLAGEAGFCACRSGWRRERGDREEAALAKACGARRQANAAWGKSSCPAVPGFDSAVRRAKANCLGALRLLVLHAGRAPLNSVAVHGPVSATLPGPGHIVTRMRDAGRPEPAVEPVRGPSFCSFGGRGVQPLRL